MQPFTMSMCVCELTPAFWGGIAPVVVAIVVTLVLLVAIQFVTMLAPVVDLMALWIVVLASTVVAILWELGMAATPGTGHCQNCSKDHEKPKNLVHDVRIRLNSLNVELCACPLVCLFYTVAGVWTGSSAYVS